MQKNKTKDIIVVGFALFAIFFGAGNLIFPPYLGVMSGDGWITSAVGFLIADPVFPVLGVIATAMVGGMPDDMGKRVGHKFAVALGFISVLVLCVLFAVPRTAATAHEVFTVQVFGDGTLESVPAVVTSLIFFILSWICVIRSAKVVDIIGKFLTPVLLIILIGTIIVAIFNPAGEIASGSPGLEQGMIDSLFIKGFTEGYQTMDALGSALMAGIVVSDLINKGYNDEKERFRASVGVGLVAAILLAIVYGGLTYVGATVSGSELYANEYLPADNRTGILVGVFTEMYGAAGKWAIGIATALACLTTSVGLTGVAGNFFTRVFHKDEKFYKIIVTCSTILAFFISLFGVNTIINFAVPILAILYPIYMCLFIITLFDKFIKYNWVYTGAVIFTAIISIPKGIAQLYAMNGWQTPGFLASITEFYGKLPLAFLDLNWIVPAIIGMVVFGVISAVGHVGKTRDDM